MQMHIGQVKLTRQQVSRLVATQFPDWAGLALHRVEESGTDHVLYRLGDTLVLRLPIIEWAVGQVDTDQRWLPRLAPHLTLPVPLPVAVGRPGHGYPFRWTVVPWIEGEPATATNLDLDRAADDLAAFVRSLRIAPVEGGPVNQGTRRGGLLAALDEDVRGLIAELADDLDVPAVTRVWDAAVRAAPGSQLPVWIHGDLAPGNLLVRARRLVAVIDVGSLGLGDPAADLAPAWNLFDGSSRERFLAGVAGDDGQTSRARGWVLAPALQGLGYYRDSRPDLSAAARDRIAAVTT